MANEITVIELGRNSQSDTLPAAQAVDTSTGAYIDVGGLDASKIIIEFSSTGVASGLVKDGAEYTGGTIGDLTLTSTGEVTYYAGPFETHRFKDSDGYINLKGSTGSTADLSYRAILLP